MTKNQLTNLINFSFLFNASVDSSSFMNSSFDYIVEKYDKMIGVDIKDGRPYGNIEPIVYQISELAHMGYEKRDWEKKWNIDIRKLSFKEKSIIDYLASVSVFYEEDLYPSKLRLIFERYIGCVDEINDIEYSHIHPKLKHFIENMMKEHKRDFNLNLVL